jgi:hypothetical protein
MARSEEGSFAWPSRERSAQIERAAAEAAERGLARLRERQRRRRPPAPAPPPDEPTVPQPWNKRYDRLADELVDDLRRDLGPERD